MIVIIDNYDSFVYNLAQMIGTLEPDLLVLRNDAITPDAFSSLDADGLVISPGPGRPADAGVSNVAIAQLGLRIPVLGVCLGLQCIAEVYGAEIVRAALPMHGKLSSVHHRGRHLFAGLPSPLEVMRYHSLVADPASVPSSLEITATTAEGEIMGIRHRELDVEGVQFHPESAFNEGGMKILENFVRRVDRGIQARRFRPARRRSPEGPASDTDFGAVAT